MIRRTAAASLAGVASLVTLRVIARRGAARLLAAPRTMPDEASLGPALDALGGEIVRLRARDGLRLAGRWLPAQPSGAADPADSAAWLYHNIRGGNCFQAHFFDRQGACDLGAGNIVGVNGI